MLLILSLKFVWTSWEHMACIFLKVTCLGSIKKHSTCCTQYLQGSMYMSELQGVSCIMKWLPVCGTHKSFFNVLLHMLKISTLFRTNSLTSTNTKEFLKPCCWTLTGFLLQNNLAPSQEFLLKIFSTEGTSPHSSRFPQMLSSSALSFPFDSSVSKNSCENRARQFR